MKRYKICIWRGVLSMAVVALTLVLGSCTKESMGVSMPGGDGMEVRVTFPRSEVTRAVTGGTEIGASDENRLDRVTILVFSGDGSKLESVISEDVTSANTSLPTTQPKWASDQTLIVGPVINPGSPKKIYAIANWSKTAFDKATYTETTLKDEITTITAVADINNVTAYPMLMSGSKDVENLTTLLFNVTVDMERQSSKISTHLTIPIHLQDYMPQVEWQIDLVKVTVVHVPNETYVVSRKALPPNIGLLHSKVIAMDDTKPAAGDQTVPATKELKWSESVYVTENPVVGNTQAKKDSSTYVVVQLPYKNRITGVTEYDNYYKVYINDTRDAASPHKVLRNTIYNLNISILGMGLPFNNLVPDVNVDDQLTVNSWEKGEVVDVEAPQNYFNVDSAYLEFQPSETSLKTTVATDVVDWKLVKEDGTTIFSFAEATTADVTIDGITYTLGGNVSVANVTVSRPTTLISFPIQKMFFIAKNLKVPFTVAIKEPELEPDPAGFIPRDVLEQGGWPADRLPKKGLQLARIGNKLPSEGSEWNEVDLEWSGLNVITGTSKALGSGKSNYAILSNLDAGNYPIGQACKHLGPNWYVPSIDEWGLIYANKGTIGYGYQFMNDFWSSSEDGQYNSWYITSNLGTISSYKGLITGVRCVIEI